MPTVVAVPTACPKCGGKLWDNRETKRNSKAPDFKCRDKSCEGCVWPPKSGTYADAAVGMQPKSAAKQDAEYGFDIPGEFERPDATPAKPKAADPLIALFDLHGACWLYAKDVSKDDTVRASISATLLIAAQKAGLA